MALKEELKVIYDNFNSIYEHKNIEFSKIKAFYTELSRILFNCNELEKNETKHLVDCCLLFIKYIVTFVNINQPFDKQCTEILQKCLEIIGEFSKSTVIQDVYVAHITIPLLKFVLISEITEWLSGELLKNLIIVLKNSNEQLRYVLGRSNIEFLFRVLEKIRTCGDFEFQLLVMEVIFLMLSDQLLKLHAHLLFPEYDVLQKAFFKIDRNDLFYSNRTFLNVVNSIFKNIFSFKVEYILMGLVNSTQDVNGSSELWIDFNVSSKSLSFHCNNSSFLLNRVTDYDNGIKIIKIFFEDVNIVKMSKLSKNDECLILFRLNTPCVELHTQSVAISNIKIVIFNNSDIEALEKVLLPRFFKEKFEKMELKSQDENNGEDKKTKTKSKKSLNVKKTKSSLKTIDKKASSGISCLNTQLRDDKKPTKELRKSTETDKNQKDIPCKSIIRFPKIAVKGNQLRGNTFKGKRNNTFDNVFEADFENLPHAKKINKLSLTCNLKNSNVKDTFNNPILSLTQDKSTARYESLTDNQYHKEKGSRTRQTSSKTKAQRTLSRKAIEDELPSSKLTLSYSENGIKSSEVLKNTSNPMADEGTLDNKLNDLKTLRDKYEQLKPAASEGNLTGFTDKMKSNNDFKVIDDVIEISADDDDLININIDSRNAVLKGRNVLLKSDESLNNTLSHIAEEDSFEIKISNLKILRHQSQQLKHVTSVGNLFGFTDNLKSNKCLNVIDDIIEISDNDDDVIENNVSIDSRNVVRKRRNVLLKCDESLNTTLNHKAKEDSFENKVSNLKILRHRSQQFKHVASEGNLFGFTDKLKSNKAFNVIDDIIEIKDNDENIIENVNIDSPNVVEKNVLFKSESLKTRLDHVEKEDLFENKVVNLKTLRHQSQQLKHVECEGNLFGFTERLKFNKNFNAIDNIIEISDDEDNNLVENNANIGSQIIIRKARNALIQTESSKTKSNDTVEQNLLENNLFSLKTTGHYSQLETPIKLDRSVFDSGLLTNASNNKIISQGVIENSVNVSSPSTNIESASTAQIKKTFENSFSQNVSDEDSSLPIIAVCTPKQVLRLSKLLNKKSKKLEEKVIQDIEVFKSKSTLENRCKFEFDRIDEGIYERKHEKVISRKEESERAQEVDCELKFRNCLEEIRNAKLSVCKKLSKVDENLSDNSASSLLNISATSIYSANNVDKGFNVRNDEDSQTLTKTVTVTPIKTQAPLLNPTFVKKQLIDTVHKISFCHKRDYAELEKDENFTSENTFSDSLLSESLSCYSRHDTIASKESARMENDFCCHNTSLNANLRSIFDNNSSSDLQDTRNINLVSKLTSRKNELEFHNDASSNISTIINNAVKDTEVVLNDNSTEKKNLKHSQELLQELYSQSLFSSIEENQISQTNSITNEVLANSCLFNTKICNNSLKFFEDTVLQVPNNENVINLDTQNNQQSPTIKLKTNSNVEKEILFGNNKEFVKEAVSNVNMLPDVITNARSLNTEINECVEYDFIPETPLKETITTEKIILYPIPIEDSFISKETVTSENQILTENLIEDHLISTITFQDTSATEKNCLTQNESKKANMVENQLSEVTTDKVETDDKLCKRVSVIIDYTTQKAVTKILQMQSIQKSVHVKSTSEINKISNLKNMTELLQLKENDQSKNITNKTAVQNKNWFSNDKTVDRIAASTFKKDINDFTKLHQTITNSFTSTHSKSSSKYSSKKIKLYNPNNPVITGNTEEPLLIDAQNSQSLQISNALTKNFKRNFEYSSTFSQSSNKPAKKMNRKNFVPNETLLSSGVKKKSKSNLFLNKTNKINTGKTKKINILQNLVIHPGKRIVNCNFEKKQETLDEIISNIQNNEKFNSLIKSICTQMKISQDNGKPKQMPHCNDDKLFRKPAKRSSTWKIFDDFNNNCASKVKKNDTIKDNTLLQNSLQENDFDENLKNNYEELYKLILKCSKSGNNDETRTKVISVIDGVLANLNHTYKSLQERFSHEKDTSSSNDKLLNVLENLIATINKYLIQK